MLVLTDFFGSSKMERLSERGLRIHGSIGDHELLVQAFPSLAESPNPTPAFHLQNEILGMGRQRGNLSI